MSKILLQNLIVIIYVIILVRNYNDTLKHLYKIFQTLHVEFICILCAYIMCVYLYCTCVQLSCMKTLVPKIYTFIFYYSILFYL